MIFYSKFLTLGTALTLLTFNPRLEAEPATFATRVAPVLEKNCTGCHGENKQKGGLRLDTIAHIMRGSDDRPVVKASDFTASELHRRITLPASDDEVMPTDGKPLLSAADITLLEKWIAAGAPATEPFDAPALARSLVGIGFACTLLASVLSVRAIVPAALQATGQALYQSVSYGLAVAIAALVGGIIYGELGAAPLFLLSGAVMFGAIPFAWRVLR